MGLRLDTSHLFRQMKKPAAITVSRSTPARAPMAPFATVDKPPDPEVPWAPTAAAFVGGGAKFVDVGAKVVDAAVV